MGSGLQTRHNFLWPLSIAGALLLQLVLGNILWHVCSSFTAKTTPAPKVINLSLPLLPAETPPEKPAEILPEQVITEPEPVIEPLAEPLIEPEPVVDLEPLVKPEMQPEPILEPLPQPVPLPKPVEVQEKPITIKKPLKKIAAKPAVPPQKIAKTPPIERKPKTVVAPEPAPKQVIKSSPAPQQAMAGPKVAAPKDFSGYLQKVFRQIEKNKRYPSEARRYNIKGKVQVSFSINSQGQATNVTTTNKAAPELTKAALKLLAGQKFPTPPPDWNQHAKVDLTINYSLR